ncbi:tripartite tricarboxylate transporter TctB family protein [Jannaschia formosa]|uniref:tripartite tricarboxylate transporter TctB family protein n=1 Tax=Jannaschia formosa TaxID=2259592 RepID=UPI000E1C0045|nr:tripartite tricarboxylate transporter TctB family protein [Jannaschia formosa]TFL16359.1 hypothetical protein DR046_20550 [Jannaschia formosa]
MSSPPRTTPDREAGRRLDTRDGDILSGAVVMIFALIIFLQVDDLPKGAANFPRGIAVVLGLGGALLILRSLRVPRSGKGVAEGYSWRLFGLAVVLWAGTVWLIRPLDFFIVAPAFLSALSWIMAGLPRSPGGIARAAVFGVIASVVVWVIFVRILGVALP